MEILAFAGFTSGLNGDGSHKEPSPFRMLTKSTSWRPLILFSNKNQKRSLTLCQAFGHDSASLRSG